MKSMTTSLPDNILEGIINANDIHTRVISAFVCRRWRRLSNSARRQATLPMAIYAVENNYFNILHWVEPGWDSQITQKTEIYKFLYFTEKYDDYDLVKYGPLEFIKWLYRRQKSWFDWHDLLAGKRFDVFSWAINAIYHDTGTHKFDRNVHLYGFIIKSGIHEANTEFLDYLHYLNIRITSPSYLLELYKIAIKTGDIEVLDWLRDYHGVPYEPTLYNHVLNNRARDWLDTNMISISPPNHASLPLPLELVELILRSQEPAMKMVSIFVCKEWYFLLKTRKATPGYLCEAELNIVDFAIKECYPELAKWGLQQGLGQLSDSIAFLKCPKILKYLLKHGKFNRAELVKSAAHHGNVFIMEWYYDQRIPWPADIYILAASGWGMAGVIWLNAHGVPFCGDDLIWQAMSNGYTDLVHWLNGKGIALKDDFICEIADNEGDDIYDWVHENNFLVEYSRI